MEMLDSYSRSIDAPLSKTKGKTYFNRPMGIDGGNALIAFGELDSFLFSLSSSPETEGADSCVLLRLPIGEGLSISGLDDDGIGGIFRRWYSFLNLCLFCLCTSLPIYLIFRFIWRLFSGSRILASYIFNHSD